MIKFFGTQNHDIEDNRKDKIKAKELACFMMALCLMITAVFMDYPTTAEGKDLTETPHSIMAGNKELAVVESSAVAYSAIDEIIAYYGGGNDIAKAYVNPALKVQVKTLKAGEANPKVLDKHQAVNDIIEQNKGKNPIFTVTVNSSLFRKEKIPYSVKNIKTKKMYKGKTKITQKGKDGIRLITGSGTLVNGKLVNSIVYEKNVISKPVPQIVKVGTKKKIVKGAATGDFIWPLPSSHYISSGYGYRYGPYFGNEFHMGYDIAGSYGASVLAADGGVVVKAAYHPSYGNEVVIDHGNGLQTRYAHNSSLNVHVGQKVSRGDVIALCGSTGDSTGNHLHFEVLKNGTHTDPAPYL